MLRKKRNNVEQKIHMQIVKWFELAYPKYFEDFHHFANERKCSVITGSILKKMGVKRGVSDFHLGVAKGGFFGLWIELKIDKGKLTSHQKSFIDRKMQRGYLAIVAWGFDEAVKIIDCYLKMSDTYFIDSKDVIKQCD